MKMNRLLLSTVLIVSVSFPVWAAKDAGLPGEFLNFGVGARALGMGRAYTGVADDVDAIYYNPAGLASFRSSQVTFQHSGLPVDGAYQYIGYATPIYSFGSLGLGVINLDSGDVARIDSNNIEIGSFDSRETGYLVSYAQMFKERLALGGTLKMAEKSVDNIKESGFGADLGTLLVVNERVKLGAMFRNAVAPKYDFNTEKEEFPVIFRAGPSVTFLNKHLLTSLDLEKTIGTSQSLRWHFGLEGYVLRNVFLRAGVDKTEITTGLGLRWKSWQFDYAGGFQDLGFINRFAIKFFFGGYSVDIKAFPEVFSPTGLKNKVNFKIHTAHRSRIVNWIMTIRNARNKVIRSFQGYKAPPTHLEWDGRDTKGRIVPAGQYTFRMRITDSKNRSETTPTRSIRVLPPTLFACDAT
ncbi:hypothetical protein BVX98_00950 [bacterium F11]|nr:hypothetical protein BVX98_00950 [bacterium F11]